MSFRLRPPIFLVESSYADRLRNRQPDEMTGNYDYFPSLSFLKKGYDLMA